MSLTLQLSDKRGDAILLAKVELDDLSDQAIQQAEAQLAAAAGLVGLGESYERFGAAAPATVPAVTQLIRPVGQPAQQPAAVHADPTWGQPPVPPFQPAQAPQAAPQVPGAAAPFCHHGQRVFISGTSNKPPYREWKAWACPADRNDPTKCEKEWIR